MTLTACAARKYGLMTPTRSLSRIFLLPLSGAFVLGVVALSACSQPAASEARLASPGSTPTITASPAFHSAGQGSVADVVETVLPSVVSVTSTKHVRSRSPMELFFGGPSAGRPQQGLGSGGVITADGIVVTNNHVIEGADEIVVHLNDDRDFTAKLIGSDPKSDVAVLQLEGDLGKLTPISVGDSSELRLGDVVLAVGNPFGVGQTVTMGIVSATGRSELGIVDYENFIQTDAAINPGNSGGALINMKGQLVGINTAILSRTGGSMGIGFAIPTNMAAPIIEALKTNGEVSRGFLGVSIQEIDGDIRSALALKQRGGVLVADVQSGGPADRAGIKSGDVVLQVNEAHVNSPGHFRNLIAQSEANKTVALKLVREGKEKTLQVALGQMPSDGDSGRQGSLSRENQANLDGLSFSDLDESLRQRLDVPLGLQGAVIVRVTPDSKGAQAGLRPGDVILQINNTPIKDAAAASRVYRATKGTKLLQLLRRGAKQFVAVK